jgi:hypothetical protein
MPMPATILSKLVDLADAVDVYPINAEKLSVELFILTIPKGPAGKRSTSSTRSTDFSFVPIAHANIPGVALISRHDPTQC